MLLKPSALVALAAVAAAQNNSVYDILQANTQTTQLFKLLNTSYPGIVDTLRGTNNPNWTYTIFAPADSAFTPQVQSLLPTISDLNDLLLYHIVNGTHRSVDFKDGPNILDTLVNNGSLLKWSNGAGLAIDIYKNASASSTPAPASAASSTATDSSSSSTMTGAAAAASQSSTPFTVYTGFSSAQVIQTDIQASNGIIHLINGLLTLPQPPSLTIANSPGAVNEQLSQFSAVVNQTQIGSYLDSVNGVTIFAPYNQAFSNVNLSGLTNDSLTKILKYHAINQVLYSTNISLLTGPTNFTALEDDNLTISRSGGDITVGNSNTTAKVIFPDILTDNGVIHIIDKVLWPPSSVNGSNDTTNGSSNNSKNGASAAHISTTALLLSLVTVACSLFL